MQTLECNVIFHGPGSHLDCRVLFDSNFFLFFPGARHAKSDTQAIPLLKQYSLESALSPKGFPRVFACAVMSTASRPHENGANMCCISCSSSYYYCYASTHVSISHILRQSWNHIVDAAMPQALQNDCSELRKTTPMSQRALFLNLDISSRSTNSSEHLAVFLFLCSNVGVSVHPFCLFVKIRKIISCFKQVYNFI